ncbi:hypothetical protein MCA1591 [Methylococcus capsulatus str. Bath]|uniref:Uncharacterized protein n=1 Tax=Methylococcus capsulatus (strain ATCC 33009 / NCIMB 11132 / Bath) TaxID=243233 RepID=Q608A6_METCA|nr:hypothetical protein MCA1591 [Methylococcus capsulatus str. Bath]
MHAGLKDAHGSPRRVGESWGRGFPAGQQRVERLMPAAGPIHPSDRGRR